MAAQPPKYDIYLANALFSEADQAFNNHVAARLRAAGLSVFLPQETGENRAVAPTAEEIFVSDAQRIARSRVLLAVLDGDVLDDGVACEIGLAFGMGVPVVGLWTDLRRFRTGEGRIYRNIFVTGAIERNGIVCPSTPEAVERCVEVIDRLNPGGRASRVVDHYAASREALADVLPWIQSAYQPAFDPGEEIVRQLEAARPPSFVLDVGAGDGWLGPYITGRWPAARYVPIDPAYPDRATLDDIEPGSVDTIVLAYVLHDVPDAGALLGTVSRLLRPDGDIVILDLSSDDLPVLCGRLRDIQVLGSDDPRLSAGRIVDLASGANLNCVGIAVIIRDFVFGTRAHLEKYIAAFGLDKGLDLPWLPLAPCAKALTAIAASLEYPFLDRRSFVSCRLTKSSTSP